MKWIAVVLCLSGLGMAADCPGEVVHAFSAGYSQVIGCPTRYCLDIDLVNHTGKKIVGAKFGVEFVDAVGDPHGSPFHYTSDDVAKPNKKHGYRWFIDEAADDSGGVNAWVEKLLFDDGSTWEDDGNKVCKHEHWNRAANKK